MRYVSEQFPGYESTQISLAVPGPKDPPNTPVPRLLHSTGAPDADHLGRLLVEALDRVQTLDEAVVHSIMPGSANGSGERMDLGDNTWIPAVISDTG